MADPFVDPPAELRVAGQGDPVFNEAVALVEFLRASTAPISRQHMDDLPNHYAVLMTACCLFAGSLFGTLIYMGVASGQDKRRVTESMATNFRQGIDVGLRRAARVEQELGEGGSA